MERDQLYKYETFNILPKRNKPPEDYQQIKARFVYTIKHDLRHKARLIAQEDMMPPNKDQEYAGVVPLLAVLLALLLGELHGPECMVGDVGNAYLESYTKEKVYFIAGPEFEEMEGRIMVISKALYGLRSSGS